MSECVRSNLVGAHGGWWAQYISPRLSLKQLCPLTGGQSSSVLGDSGRM